MTRFMGSILCWAMLLVACSQVDEMTPTGVSETPIIPVIASADPGVPPPASTPNHMSQPQTPVTALLSNETPNDLGYIEAVDSLGHRMVLLPAQKFQAGFTVEQAQRLCDIAPWDDYCVAETLVEQHPPRQSTIARDFWIDKYEVTMGEYRACLEAGVCELSYFNPAFLEKVLAPTQADYPMTTVTWFEARTFCTEWRGGTLPTEAQWEYAARGTDGRLWPWGNEAPTESLARYTDYEIYGEASFPVEPVGSYPNGVSPFGLYDMAGNVGEWTLNWVREDGNVLQITEGPQDGYFPLARGGSYLDVPDQLATAVRIFHVGLPPTLGLAGIGFRCVLSAEP